MSRLIKSVETVGSTSASGSSASASGHSVMNLSRLAEFVRSIYFNDRRLQCVLLLAMLIWYGALLAVSLKLAPNDQLRLTFNSMLQHLLRGQFDVDPQIVGWEGYLRNGHVYSYFGIWCALLRLPLWAVGRMNLDITFWSCLGAVCIASMAKIRAVLLVRRAAVENASAQWAIGLMLSYFVLAGSAVAYLNDAVWTEVMLWAYGFAAVFVYCALKGILNRGFDLRLLSCMALSAGLALLTRVSTGVGLIVTLVLLLVAIALNSRAGEVAGKSSAMRRLGGAITQRRTAVPIAILSVFIAATGTVNYFRWGNPATFVNYDFYLLRNYWPSFISSLHTYGPFNIKRIPYGIVYYFFPIWVLHGSNGQLLFESTQSRLFGDIELPPSSFFLTDLVPFCFIVLLVIALRRRVVAGLAPAGQWAAAVAAGLMTPCLLMLSLAWMTYRYRVEFYPELEFLGLLGLYLTVTDTTILAFFAKFRKGFSAALIISIVASVIALALFDVSGDDPPERLLGRGIVGYYDGIVRHYYDRAVFHLK